MSRLWIKRLVSFFARASEGRLRREGESRDVLEIAQGDGCAGGWSGSPEGAVLFDGDEAIGGGWTKIAAKVAFMDDYSLRPLRGGQVVVASSEPGPLVAYRSVLTPAGGLTWSALDACAKGSLVAVAGLCEFHQQALRHVNRPCCALSERQLAQLAAHRAYLLTMDFKIDIERLPRAVEQVLIVCLGESVTFALEQLLMLGLDLDASRDRVALQLVINLAQPQWREWKTSFSTGIADIALGQPT
jgi:hypothetical protein